MIFTSRTYRHCGTFSILHRNTSKSRRRRRVVFPTNSPRPLSAAVPAVPPFPSVLVDFVTAVGNPAYDRRRSPLSIYTCRQPCAHQTCRNFDGCWSLLLSPAGNNRAGSSSTSTASKRTSRRRRRKDEPVSARSLRFQRETAKASAAQRLARKRHEAQLEAKKTAAAEAPCGSVGCDANSETSNPDSANNDPADSNSARVTGRPTVVGEGTSLLGKHSREYGEDEEEDDERRQGNVEEYGTADEVTFKRFREPTCSSFLLFLRFILWKIQIFWCQWVSWSSRDEISFNF